jgi:hypothetical protein
MMSLRWIIVNPVDDIIEVELVQIVGPAAIRPTWPSACLAKREPYRPAARGAYCIVYWMPVQGAQNQVPAIQT